MSVTYFIVPIKPDEWETESSSLKISANSLEVALKETWPDITIYHPSPESFYLLRWHFNHLGGPGTISGLQDNQQVVSFGHDVYLHEFIVWYREFVHPEHTLYLTCSAYGISDYIVITIDITSEGIDRYLNRR